MRPIFAPISTLFLAAWLLAACQTPAPPRPWVGLAPGGRAIDIFARERERLIEAALLLPDGRRIAGQIELVAAPPAPRERPSIGVGASGGSSSGLDSGIGLSIPMGWLTGGTSGPAERVDSRARIAVPDDTAPPFGRVLLVFGDGRRVEIPAPGR